ncbi:MAG: hypothetical protein ABI614_00795 [Planctomycetota bacterium]
MTKTEKQPVLLTVLVETGTRRWFVAGIALDGQAVPLMCSEPGNLDAYVGVVFDEQVSFLRHRLSGVLQRGCDRLWGRQMKARQIVFVVDADFEQATSDLTQRVADHFVEWMTSPPVVFFKCANGFPNGESPTLDQLAGNLDDADREALATGLPRLIAELENSNLWELAQTKLSN